MKFNLFLLVAITLFFGMSLTTNVNAQKKQSGIAPKPITTQTATTDEGRKVILKSNGTWQYEAENSAIADTTKVKPRIKSTPAAQNALRTLRRMTSATEVGINFQEYSTRLIDLKADVDEELSQLSVNDLKQEIKLALEAYVDAGTAWNKMLRYEIMLTEFEPAKTLQEKYSIPAEPSSSGGSVVYRSVALSTIWGAAKKHIENATQLMR